MTRAGRGAFLALLVVVLLALGAWRVAVPSGSAAGEPGGAESRTAFELSQARAALAAGDTAAAARRARAVLAAEPLTGPAYALLAQALAGQGRDAEVLARYQVAARRAPRDVHVRSWMAAHALQAGDFATALTHVDALLTVSPPSRGTLLPMLAQLAQTPEFADALAAHLAANPRWRGAVLHAVDTGVGGDQLFVALRRAGQLSADEEAAWIAALLRADRWGDAYAHWVGGLPATRRVPLLYNGAFEQPPTSRGFDWHVARVTGVVFRHGDAEGASGARLAFLGRPVGDTGLSHPLLLAPGRYQLSVRARAPDLRAEQGLEWVVACAPGASEIARGARISAARQWQVVRMTFEIPDSGCKGQWLRLVNPAPAGVAQGVRGDVELQAIHVGPMAAAGAMTFSSGAIVK